MRVISNNRKTWSLEVSCRSCHSVLEVKEDDVKRGQFGAMGDYDTEYYVVCAVCENHCIISKDTPSFVKSSADKRKES